MAVDKNFPLISLNLISIKDMHLKMRLTQFGVGIWRQVSMWVKNLKMLKFCKTEAAFFGWW